MGPYFEVSKDEFVERLVGWGYDPEVMVASRISADGYWTFKVVEREDGSRVRLVSTVDGSLVVEGPFVWADPEHYEFVKFAVLPLPPVV